MVVIDGIVTLFIDTESFSATWNGKKNYVCGRQRRIYVPDEIVKLKEKKPDGLSFTGRTMDVKITYVSTKIEGLISEYCIFGFLVLIKKVLPPM
jgi:hypothetical protein